MAMSVVELISIGLSIKISRSDGRVHGATVKAIHPNKGVVSVEWQENSATKGKEVDVNELYNLNRELVEFLKSSNQPEPTPTQPNKSEIRLRSSRIPAPPETATGTRPTEVSDSVHRKSMVRRTCAVNTGVPSLPSSAEDGALVPEQPVESLLNGPGSRNQRRLKRGVAMPPSLLPRVPETGAEPEAPAARITPAAGTARRKSVVPSEAEKNQNKRRASQAKHNTDLRAKRGNGGETNRPHWQFYKMIEEYRETLELVPISLSDPVEDHKICVCVRKRPLNKQEVARKEIDVVSIPGRGVLLLHEPKQKVDLTKYLENQLFKFDYSFDETASNEMVYRFTAKPLVQTVFEGGVATCFAYGQTGSGKTHTMGGDFSGKNQNSSKGVYALAAQDVFTLLEQRRYVTMGLEAYVTFFEIYNGKVFDLLNKKAKLRVLEDGKQQVQVVGLQEMYVSSPSEVIRLIDLGSSCRTSGQTFANSNSSRSHAVLQIILRRGDRLHGKFSLVDLAGNERGNDVSSNDRQALVETAEINRSLLALKECIRSLGKNSDHIPFRMSKLTQVLRDSFIGENSRTCMIAMISPGMTSCDYTLNTLRYADRVKELNTATAGNSDTDSDKKSEMEVDEDEEEESLSAEDTVLSTPSVYEAVAQVTEMADRLCEVLHNGREIANAIEDRTHDISTMLPELNEHMMTLQECFQALQAAVKTEELSRMPKKGQR
ncbi:kinesin-like protein KIF2C isoform X1 [Conger conger]|uniref:kinesin-like protein KIF2C isoform X1 n=1 Tax=Conger conger TaxID=82655 RepID=UPI002A5A9633|nr:kinesin-like protein KIF2C isoform X1 [Conger conger]